MAGRYDEYIARDEDHSERVEGLCVCGVYEDEPCSADCLCRWCVEARGREAALRALDVIPEEVGP